MGFRFNKKLADAVDEWRIVPRILVGMYCYLLYYTAMWFMALPDPSGTQAAFVSTIVGAAAAIFGLYTNAGKNKSGE
ncbi:TMhelix containing protein [Vibrio phage 1.081.O._10N.286.52.C2]|nr:TMhelix containing protein [Vibrio phage 1.081.O._10N.286.52.C2]